MTRTPAISTPAWTGSGGSRTACRWYNSSEEEDAVRLKYGYDSASNRLWRQDDVARSQSQNFDELYTYDGLQRLKTMQRGLLNGNHDTISSQNYGQCWNLDATENWTRMKQAEGGSDWTLEQSRTANPVNEITDITNTVGPVWAQPAYDPAGNMTTIPQSDNPENSFTATWDAWNRLVQLVDDNTEDTIAEYQYDAHNRRIIKKLYTSGVLDQTRHLYLSEQNQVLEEQIGSSSDAALQNTCGLMYIDGLILRDRDTNENGTLDERRYCLQDANWNAAALTNESGTITQRFCYQPFGTCQFLDASYATSTDTSQWTTLFTGRELDRESLLYYFRARYFSSLLGAFLKKDPIGYAECENLYAYTLNNPISWIDPSGLQVFFAGPPPIFIFEQHPWYYDVIRAPAKFDDITIPKGTPPQPAPQPAPTGGMSGPKGGSFQSGPPAGTLYPPPTGTQSGTSPQGSPETSYNPQFPDSPGLERFKADRKSRGCPSEEAYECHHIVPQALFNPRWASPHCCKHLQPESCLRCCKSFQAEECPPGTWDLLVVCQRFFGGDFRHPSDHWFCKRFRK